MSSENNPDSASDSVISLKTNIAEPLFSYNCGALCSAGKAGFDSLSQAVSHYVELTVARDGYYDAEISARVDGDSVQISLSRVPENYVESLRQYIEINQIGLRAAVQVNSDGLWLDGWTFFPTWGMALQNQKAVQLLHFPPDTSPKFLHDDLLAATTLRWTNMLLVNKAVIGSTYWYQSIDNILPIGAPADSGEPLNKVIPYFEDYARRLLEFKVLPRSAAGNPRPLVVFGGPARQWFQSTYLENHSSFGPLDLVSYSLGQLSGLPALGSNHPSDIFYQSPRWGEDARRIMWEDAVAAWWEVHMGQALAELEDPGETDLMRLAQDILDDAKDYWNRDALDKLCRIYWETTFNVWPGDAAAHCGNS